MSTKALLKEMFLMDQDILRITDLNGVTIYDQDGDHGSEFVEEVVIVYSSSRHEFLTVEQDD